MTQSPTGPELLSKTNIPCEVEECQLTESLQRRLFELEGFAERVEADAANTVALAEELTIAKSMTDQALCQAENSESRTRSVLDAVVDGIVSISADGTIESVNASSLRMLGATESELLGEKIEDIVFEFEGRNVKAVLQESACGSAGERGGVTLQCRVRPRGRAPFPAELIMTKLTISGQLKFTCVLRDITERKNAEAAIQKLALYDQLTGAANRHEFQRRLDTAINLAGRQGVTAALLLLDLDKFKDVNDTYGHPTGDELLISVTRVLEESVRGSDTVARIGGDEFAIILNSVVDPLRIRQVAERIVNGLSQPTVVDGSLISTGASIGISIYPRDAKDAKELVRLGDKALYEAKRRGRGNYQYYDEVMDADARAEQVLENDLRLALVRNELELYFQPQLATRSGLPIGAEALVRWRHPTRGLLMPGDFIPLAERSGLIVDIGKQVLFHGCYAVQEWNKAGINSLQMAVNVSPCQFINDQFLQTVSDALDRTGIEPHSLELEITESSLIEDPEKVRAKLEKIRGLGVSVAIDDFGTGYASLAYLRDFPVQKLKIDRTFIKNLTTSVPDRAIAEAIVNLGRSLKIDTIAEGVETYQQADAIRRTACSGMQGYYFSRPLPKQQFWQWLRER